MERDALEALWQAANDHCTMMYGQWVPDDYEGDECPPAPEDGADILRIVTQYLRDAR
jgi:hypothetical protein